MDGSVACYQDNVTEEDLEMFKQARHLSLQVRPFHFSGETNYSHEPKTDHWNNAAGQAVCIEAKSVCQPHQG